MKAKILLLIAVLTAIAAAAREYAPADIPNVQVERRDRYVSNPDGILSPAAVAELDSYLDSVWNVSTAEVALVVVDSIAPGYTDNSFANELFDLWKIGKSDTENGLLILVVRSQHRVVARTGRGTSAVLPDALCGRILSQYATPRFREEDYDGGVMAATKAMGTVLLDPDSAADIVSEQGRSTADDSISLFDFVIRASVVGGAGMLLWVIWIIVATRRREELYRYTKLLEIRPVALFLSFLCLGMALPAYLLCVYMMKRLRDHGRKCPNCDHPMRKLDEQTDNLYLTPAQDAEERLNSVDYDVWLCDECGATEIIPYVNKQSAYTNCARCGARTCVLAENRVLRQPTTKREGQGERIYLCHNCGQRTAVPYSIAKLASAGPVVFIPGGGGGGGFGGGGFGGGFGGGGTSGGGASVGW